MAEGGRRDISEDIRRTKNARQVSELFRGRLKEEDTMKLLEKNEYDVAKTVSYILENEPADVAKFLGNKDSENMAEGGAETLDPEIWQKKRDIRNVRELFHGRFTDREAQILLRHFGWDKGRTVQNILNAEPGALRELLDSNDVEARIAIVTENDVLRDYARRNRIIWEIRQYGCGPCDSMWWRRVVTRKPVSRCHKCRQKYDPIPRDQEWGWGEFECECGNTFKGMGAMGQTECMCYRCGRMCPIVRILPPLRENRPKPSRTMHSCTAHNCYNKKGRGDRNKTCMHPKSQPFKVLVASKHHQSTGSTVKTFLNQDDIEPPYEPSLDGLPEISDEEGDNQ